MKRNNPHPEISLYMYKLLVRVSPKQLFPRPLQIQIMPEAILDLC